MLEVTLFGQGKLRFGDRLVTGFPNQTPYLLFCYLLLNREHPHNRERLAAVFWGDSSTSSARKMLRNTLWRLRQALLACDIPVEHYLQYDDDSLILLNNQPMRIDVEEFQNIVLAVQDVPPQQMTPAQAAALETAASLYSGDLLENVYDDWCLYDRERLRLMYQNLLCKLMLYAGLRGNYEQGIGHGQRLLGMDSTWEKVHRQLMWLYWLAGDRGSALGQYKLCRQILREALATAPTQETQRQYDQMLHGKFDPLAWLESLHPTRPITLPGAERSSVSRLQSELHRLREMIEAARAESDLIEKLLDETLYP